MAEWTPQFIAAEQPPTIFFGDEILDHTPLEFDPDIPFAPYEPTGGEQPPVQRFEEPAVESPTVIDTATTTAASGLVAVSPTQNLPAAITPSQMPSAVPASPSKWYCCFS